MISRIVLSLREAADAQQGGWSLGAQATAGINFSNMEFLHSLRGPNGREAAAQLDTQLES